MLNGFVHLVKKIQTIADLFWAVWSPANNWYRIQSMKPRQKALPTK